MIYLHKNGQKLTRISESTMTLSTHCCLSFMIIFLSLTCFCAVSGFRKFPDGFIFGVSTAAYQIEGAWNLSGKGESIWDRIAHTRPEMILDRSNGDVACNSYYNYKRDVEMLKELGVQTYRFSLSWTRLCPDGICVKFMKKGLQYYNNLIDELIRNNIKPAISLYHWDLPQRLQDLGGWTNPIVAQYFEWYAHKAFEAFGDRVQMWLTFNEPRDICLNGYALEINAPALKFDGVANYLCVETVLKAHARAYHIYTKNYKPKQNGRVGLTFSTHWYEPADESPENNEAAEIIRQFETGLYANPIFSKDGDYPSIVKELVGKKSSEQGLPVSRLPSLDNQSIQFIKGTADFFGINHYTTKLARMASLDEQFPTPSYDDDNRVVYFQDQKWQNASASWLKVVPWGFKNLLLWVKDTYDNPEVIIFENGYADYGELNDSVRVDYLRGYLNSLLDAIEEGCNVTAYMIWTLMDNFEWLGGYVVRFGLYHVDFEDPNRTRTPKISAEYFKNIVKNHGL